MADPRRFELDELVIRPGTYFNPQTEVLIVVDDSPQLDTELLEIETKDADWLLISDDSPIDEHRRDELVEAFQVAHQPGAMDDEDHDEVDELEADELEEE
jgi:hypothetical protein